MEANSYQCAKGVATWQPALPFFTLEPRQANTQAKKKASEQARTEQQPKEATKQPNNHTTKLANTPANYERANLHTTTTETNRNHATHLTTQACNTCRALFVLGAKQGRI